MSNTDDDLNNGIPGVSGTNESDNGANESDNGVPEVSGVSGASDPNEVAIGDENPELDITENENIEVTGTTGGNTQSVQTGQTEDGGDVLDVDLQADQDVVDIDVDLTTLTEYSDLNDEQIEKLQKIRDLAEKIKCTEFHNKGTLKDYEELIEKIRTVEIQKVDLDLELDGLDKFGKFSKEISEMILGLSARIEQVSTVNDTEFLDKTIQQMENIQMLINALDKFKIDVAATSKLRLPSSTREVSQILSDLYVEASCAKEYIDYFTGVRSDRPSEDAELSENDKNAIQDAIKAIDLWVDMTNNGLEATMKNDENIQNIKEYNQKFSDLTEDLQASLQKFKDIQASFQENQI